MYEQNLTDDQIQVLAPSVFATEPKEDVSSKYQFIPSSRILSMMRTEGWSVSKAQEQRSNLDSTQGFQRHLLRFRRDDLKFGDEFIEFVFMNAHNRSAAFNLMAGIFRMVCSNGLVVGDTFQQIQVKHMGHPVDEVMEASYELIQQAPEVAGQIEGLKEVYLTQPERKIFAESAALTVYEDLASVPFDSTRLLDPRRHSDRQDESNLWTTYNIVQENLLKGGIRGRQRSLLPEDDPTDLPKRHPKTRAIKNIQKDLKTNKALWNLATKMKELKS